MMRNLVRCFSETVLQLLFTCLHWAFAHMSSRLLYCFASLRHDAIDVVFSSLHTVLPYSIHHTNIGIRDAYSVKSFGWSDWYNQQGGPWRKGICCISWQLLSLAIIFPSRRLPFLLLGMRWNELLLQIENKITIHFYNSAWAPEVRVCSLEAPFVGNPVSVSRNALTSEAWPSIETPFTPSWLTSSSLALVQVPPSSSVVLELNLWHSYDCILCIQHSMYPT
jgi:hypothetical protein